MKKTLILSAFIGLVASYQHCGSISKARILQLSIGFSSTLYPCEKAVLEEFCVRLVRVRARTTSNKARRFCFKSMGQRNFVTGLLGHWKNMSRTRVGIRFGFK